MRWKIVCIIIVSVAAMVLITVSIIRITWFNDIKVWAYIWDITLNIIVALFLCFPLGKVQRYNNQVVDASKVSAVSSTDWTSGTYGAKSKPALIEEIEAYKKEVARLMDDRAALRIQIDGKKIEVRHAEREALAFQKKLQEGTMMYFSGANNDWVKGPVIGKGASCSVHLGLHVPTARFFAAKTYWNSEEGQQKCTMLGGPLCGGRHGNNPAGQSSPTTTNVLEHPHVARCFGGSQNTETDNFVVYEEMCWPGSLSWVVSNFGPLHERVAKIYTRQLLAGLAHLHSTGLIHRDIKAENLLIGINGKLKITDIPVTSQRVPSKMVQKDGSVCWMAPEVLNGQPPSFASDVWSTGCTVLEMLTAKPPYHDLRAKHSSDIHFIHFLTSTPQQPSLPDSLTDHSKAFLKLCFLPENQRPTIEDLLAHSWLQSLNCDAVLPVQSPQQRHEGTNKGSSTTITTTPAQVTTIIPPPPLSTTQDVLPQPDKTPPDTIIPTDPIASTPTHRKSTSNPLNDPFPPTATTTTTVLSPSPIGNPLIPPPPPSSMGILPIETVLLNQNSLTAPNKGDDVASTHSSQQSTHELLISEVTLVIGLLWLRVVRHPKQLTDYTSRAVLVEADPDTPAVDHDGAQSDNITVNSSLFHPSEGNRQNSLQPLSKHNSVRSSGSNHVLVQRASSGSVHSTHSAGRALLSFPTVSDDMQSATTSNSRHKIARDGRVSPPWTERSSETGSNMTSHQRPISDPRGNGNDPHTPTTSAALDLLRQMDHPSERGSHASSNASTYSEFSIPA